MRFTTIILVAVCLIALVNSLPLAENGALQSQALDRLVMVESDNDATQRSKRTIGILRQLFPQISEQSQNRENQEQEESNNEAAGSENNEVRVAFADQGTAANEADAELAPLEDIEASDDENRNKRFLNFGLGGNSGGTSGGSGGGSGNFLFDIIRLVAGSGSSGSNGGADPSVAKQDPALEAVPGPVTRLLVIANRGISNLLQDLILRLAATSERIVNFKARLITSII